MPNMAQKRAKKAQRRKLVLAERRRVEVLESSPAGLVHQAVALPIQHCLLGERLFELGTGVMVLTRGSTPRNVVMSAFLVDVFCLGVRNAAVRRLAGDELTSHLENLEDRIPTLPVDPPYARKLLRELTAWAQSIGFPPHRDFATAETLFGDVEAAACDAVFRFGRDGKPLYVPGLQEDPALVYSRLAHLRRTLGDNEIGLDEFGDDDIGLDEVA
jgi:hypothetical protein